MPTKMPHQRYVLRQLPGILQSPNTVDPGSNTGRQIYWRGSREEERLTVSLWLYMQVVGMYILNYSQWNG